MKIQILESAKKDLREGFDFYESQSEGLGHYFLAAMYAEIESLKIYAGIHRQTSSRLHQLLSKRFPFAVYYRKEEGSVMIHAVLDCRRDPAWIRQKLRKS